MFWRRRRTEAEQAASRLRMRQAKREALGIVVRLLGRRRAVLRIIRPGVRFGVEPLRAVEREEHDPEHVDRREQRRQQADDPQDRRDPERRQRDHGDEEGAGQDLSLVLEREPGSDDPPQARSGGAARAPPVRIEVVGGEGFEPTTSTL